MNILTNLQLSMAATIASRWVDLRNISDCSLQLDCGALASPVGAITVEYSNDADTCGYEIRTDVDPASTAAVRVDVTAGLTVQGTALSTSGFNGSGNKASFIALPPGYPAFARVKYTRTSGGATDTLHARFVGRGRG